MTITSLSRKREIVVSKNIAKAKVANPANPSPKTAESESTLATLATLALANKKPTVISEEKQRANRAAFCDPFGGLCSVLINGVYPGDCTRINCDYRTHGGTNE
jgi:hypothetical protein